VSARTAQRRSAIGKSHQIGNEKRSYIDWPGHLPGGRNTEVIILCGCKFRVAGTEAEGIPQLYRQLELTAALRERAIAAGERLPADEHQMLCIDVGADRSRPLIIPELNPGSSTTRKLLGDSVVRHGRMVTPQVLRLVELQPSRVICQGEHLGSCRV